MMWNLRENIERNEQREGPVAVAIDRDKSSQHALKWAVEHYISRGKTVKLVHVIQRSGPTTNGVCVEDELPERQQLDNRSTKLFLPLRCLCMRRNIQSEVVLLEDQDVAKALIEYIGQNCIGTLLLGATSKKSLTRLFKGEDIPSNVMRWAPDFCNVLVISKGRLSTVRSATRPLPLILPPSSGMASPLTPSIPNDEPPSVMALSREDDILFEELSTLESDISVPSSGRPSTESAFLSFYEDLGSRNIWESPRLSSFGGRLHQKSKFPIDLNAPLDLPSISECAPMISISSENVEDVEDEMRRLKIELKQTMDMYHAACKEALAAKQKATELEIWKKKAEQRLQMAEETTLAIVEMERLKSKAAIEKAEAAQRIAGIEVERRFEVEMKAIREAEDRKKVLDALGQSRIVVQYESLLHILAVLFLFYFYFSVFK